MSGSDREDAEALTDERAAFVAWWRGKVERLGEDQVTLGMHDDCLEGWLARAALATPVEARGGPDGDVLAALDLNRLRDGSRRSLDPANQALFDEVWDLRHPTESSAETPTRAAIQDRDPVFAAPPPAVGLWSPLGHLRWFALRISTGPYPEWLREAARLTLARAQQAPMAENAKPAECSPTLTECPRCKNDFRKCDGFSRSHPIICTAFWRS